MAKTKEQKKVVLEQIQDRLSKSKSVVFSSDNGLDVKTVQEIRRELKNKGAEYIVTKKTLLKKVLADKGDLDQLNDLSGSVGLAFSYDDATTAASVLNKFSKANETLTLGGGILENELILPDVVKKLANLLSKDQLLTKLVGSLKSPITGMVGVLSGNTRNLIGVLSAIKDKKN